MEEKRIFSDNNYWVTDDGRIICYYGYKMKEINQYSTVGRKEKYKTVSLNINGRQRLFYVHRLVAEAFIDNPYNYPQVNHKDRNPSNNHVGNLEWVTAQENINHAYLTDEYKECAICKERIWSKKSNLLTAAEVTDKDKIIWLVEGEKDVDTMKKHGFLATSPPNGANYWRADFNGFFANRNIVIIPDNDEPGKKHLEKVSKNLSKAAKTVRLIDLTDIVPELKKGGDVSDV